MKKKNATKIYGIFGFPLGHTLSPYFQEAGLKARGISAHYLVFPLDEKHFKSAMKTPGKNFVLDGFNVTVPYKQTIIPYLDRLTLEAKAIGAVNTVSCEGGQWVGANTDAYGFVASLTQDGRWNPRGKKALVLGAGGSAKAVAYGLAHAGVRRLCIVNRTLSKAERLIQILERQFPRLECIVKNLDHSNWKEEMKDYDLIVNTTSVGLRKTDQPLLKAKDFPGLSSGRKMFYDLIYNPGETFFLKQARRKGHRTMNGLSMLLYQGMKSFEWWTKKKAPGQVMRKALLEAYRGVGA